MLRRFPRNAYFNTLNEQTNKLKKISNKHLLPTHDLIS